jgi:hypothetical protein
MSNVRCKDRIKVRSELITALHLEWWNKGSERKANQVE